MMRWLLVLVIAVPLAIGAVVFVASEYGGEVVILRTSDPDGRGYETSLWIIQDGRELWLRAGSSGSGWYRRVLANPEVELVRDEQVQRYRAVPDSEFTERLNELMAERYGLADRLVALFARGDDSVAIRLVPRGR